MKRAYITHDKEMNSGKSYGETTSWKKKRLGAKEELGKVVQ